MNLTGMGLQIIEWQSTTRDKEIVFNQNQSIVMIWMPDTLSPYHGYDLIIN